MEFPSPVRRGTEGEVGIQNFIADFCFHELMLIIEIDGWTHDSDKIKIKDDRKEKTLRALGYKVLRFTNEQIYGDIGKVIDRVKRICDERNS